MITISDVADLSSELRENGKIEGRVKLYHVENEDETISDATKLFQRTVLTDGLKDAFHGFKRALTGEELQRTCLLYGPYGSGKSHHMAALYHLFDSPDVSRGWLRSEGFGELAELLPADTVTIQRSMQNNQPDELWDPLFDALGTEPDLGEKNYPDIQSIRKAVGDRSVALFLDELEDWYDALEEDNRAKTRGFLQALLEASTEPDIELFFVTSVLREGSGVHKILGRESPIEVNMNDRVDTQAVIRKRLLDEDSIDYDAIEDIASDYLSAYQQPSFVTIEDPNDLQQEIIEAYPFHPEMFESLRQRWQAEGGDGVRGVVRLLSKVLLDVYDETDLIAGGDIDAIKYQDDISPVNYERQEAARRDIEEIDTDRFPYGRRILNTVLIYSLDPQYKEGADITQIVMGAYRSGEGDSAFNDIRYNLDNLMGDAVHLHRLNGKYAIREEEDVHSKIRDAATEVSEREALSIIAKHLRGIYGQSRTYTAFFAMDENGEVLDIDEIPDNKQIKVVLAPREWTSEMLEAVITNRGTGRSYRNTFVFVEPEPDMTIESGTGLLERARYLQGAESLLERDDAAIEGGLEERVNKEAETARSELDRRLRDKYGRILDGENMLGDYDQIAHMDADVFVEDGDPMNADDIAEWATVSAWQVEQTIADVAEDLVRRKGSATLTELYEQYLRLPGSTSLQAGPRTVVR